MEAQRIFIHAVYNEDGVMVCHAPDCHFVGNLSEAAWHVVEKQFKVEPPKSRRATK